VLKSTQVLQTTDIDSDKTSRVDGDEEEGEDMRSSSSCNIKLSGTEKPNDDALMFFQLYQKRIETSTKELNFVQHLTAHHANTDHQEEKHTTWIATEKMTPSSPTLLPAHVRVGKQTVMKLTKERTGSYDVDHQHVRAVLLDLVAMAELDGIQATRAVVAVFTTAANEAEVVQVALDLVMDSMSNSKPIVQNKAIMTLVDGMVSRQTKITQQGLSTLVTWLASRLSTAGGGTRCLRRRLVNRRC
jgi:hypothetical protein